MFDACAVQPDLLAADLLDRGYVVIRNLIPRADVLRLYEDLKPRFQRTPFCQGHFYGGKTKRFGALLRRSAHAHAFVLHPTMLAIADRVLGPYCDRYQLNLTQALEIHSGQTRQVPHRDQDMWRAPAGAAEYCINVMWPFTPYRRENGATLVYPGSHKTPYQSYDEREAVAAEMSPGDALVFLGSTLHGGGENQCHEPRAGMLTSYSLGWLKPYENQLLVYPPEIARTFSPELAHLIGYKIHRPSLGNYEGQCPSVLLNESVGDYLGAIDCMTEAQREKLTAFHERELMKRGMSLCDGLRSI